MLVKKMYWLLTTIVWATCPHLESIQHHQLKAKQIIETSGLVVHKKTLWMHNDSGDSARVFAHTLSKQTTNVHAFETIQAQDWEDIAIDREKQVLYIADTGDNRERRSNAKIISYNIETNATQILPISFETGPIDVEAAAWDPIDKKVYLMSKGRKGTVHTFSFSPEQQPKNPLQSQHQFSISPANGLNPERITAMDISPDGTYVAVRSYIELFLWKRPANISVHQALQKKPCVYALPAQKQGESIGFDDSGTSLWTVSEGKHQPVFELRLLRKQPLSSGEQ